MGTGDVRVESTGEGLTDRRGRVPEENPCKSCLGTLTDKCTDRERT